MKLKKLTENDVTVVKEYLKKFPQHHSGYALSSIFLWDGCIYDVWIYYDTDLLIIAEIPKEHQDKKRILFPVGKKLKVKDLKEIMEKLNYRFLYYVSEDYVNENKTEIEKYFNIYEQNDFFDYVYYSQELANLKGSKYSSKRNLIHQFEKTYNNFFRVENFSEHCLMDIINLWEVTKEQMSELKSMDLLNCERYAIENIKKYINKIDFFGVALYIGEKLSAFAIGSHLNDETCILNFRKANKQIKGLYQFIDREFAKLVSGKYKFINKEGDIGKKSLQIAKLSYHPYMIIKVYLLELKQSY